MMGAIPPSYPRSPRHTRAGGYPGQESDVSKRMAVNGEDCCDLGSRVGTRPTPTKTTEIKGDSVGSSLMVARPQNTDEKGL
jgi:hypothetical protein